VKDEFLEKEIAEGKLKFVSKDIYETDVQVDFGSTFDIIVLNVISYIQIRKSCKQ
jgi:hypothetical protein